MTFDLCRLLPGPGEEWLVRSVGAYLPAVFEEVLDVVDAVILTEKVCALGDPGLGDSEGQRTVAENKITWGVSWVTRKESSWVGRHCDSDLEHLVAGGVPRSPEGS